MLRFASETEALQYLANVTGKRIKVATKDIFNDVKIEMIEQGEIGIGWERWEDPGDYPSGAGAGPLPSYTYPVLSDEEQDHTDALIKVTLPKGFSLTDDFNIKASNGETMKLIDRIEYDFLLTPSNIVKSDPLFIVDSGKASGPNIDKIVEDCKITPYEKKKVFDNVYEVKLMVE